MGKGQELGEAKELVDSLMHRTETQHFLVSSHIRCFVIVSPQDL
jgi:hypothetical protein